MLTIQNFANLGGLGRGDLIQLYPTTNEVTEPEAILFEEISVRY